MPARGRAVVVKRSKYKHVWVDSHGDEVSPPASPEPDEPNSHNHKVKPQAKHVRNLSTTTPPSPESRLASESPQSAARRHEALAELLFDDDNNNSSSEQLATPATLGDTPPRQTTPRRASPKHSQAPRQSDRDSTSPVKELAHAPPSAPRTSRTQQPIRFINNQDSDDDALPPAPKQPADPDDMANANNFIPTGQHRHMRACMVCSIVKTHSQFKALGCPNCDNFLALRGNDEAIQECTSQVFEGLITVSNTSRSWVARYQRLEGYVPGVYAVQVEGILPEEMISAAEESGVHYIPRDGSVNEALPTD